MIKELDDLPDGVIGFETGGTMEAEDYRDVVIPAVEHAAEHGEVRFVIVIPEFAGMTGGAIWQDLKVGFENVHRWKRTAVVTDIPWITHLTTLFGWMSPGETRAFRLAERAAAVDWAAG
ncbi:STAS/SEC14 domain-containing protein [Kitasatospora viridis]|uniref:SpoIIAA-like protein n=1 Tax=Kitasatospora viridis TaxID=281105 RepID=A0A561T7E0_9ACTN|nr:STAS/SEC14 domain-containing protein [Kitasatospora viridis]TWF83020.1 SpoIIAA-like protein [Kitasatospora viridis]